MTIELIQGFVVGTLASLFGTYLFLKRRASLKSRLKKLESEEELVQKLRKSSVEYNRWNMQALFIVLEVATVFRTI